MIAAQARRGGRVFVDSGAFPAFRAAMRAAAAPEDTKLAKRARDMRVDFDRVFKLYGEIATAAGEGARNLAFVMPDVIGDQAATLALQEKHAARIRWFIDAGCDVLVPFQQGPVAPRDAYERVVAFLGTDCFRVSIPSNERAWSSEELVAFVAAAKPARVHLLGIAKKPAFARILAGILAAVPGVDVTADANHLRAVIGRGRKLTEAVHARVARLPRMARPALREATLRVRVEEYARMFRLAPPVASRAAA